MLIVGERINSTRPKIQEAIRDRNASWILKEAKVQLDAGADLIDINCAMTEGDEIQDIEWVVNVMQSELKAVGICIDSPNHLAIERALTIYKGAGSVMINSITAEESRIKNILPLAIKYKAKLVALTMSESGMPNTAYERLEIAKKILDRVRREGFKTEDLYFDALTRPISTEPDQAKEFLKAIALIKGLGSGVKTICGLSNISFGLPKRSIINAAFLAMAVNAGLDAALIDLTDKFIFSSMKAANAIVDSDEYCAEYIDAFRKGKLA